MQTTTQQNGAIAEEAAPLKVTRVLVVEDQEHDFIFIRHLLGRLGEGKYQVDWAPTYEEGLAAVSLKRHHVYLFDYKLGAENGLSLLRAAKEIGVRAPVILLTGAEDARVDMEAVTAGAADYLDKSSLDEVHLERSIRYAIRHSSTLQALRDSQRRFETFMKNMPCVVCIKNEDGRYVYVNEALESTTGRELYDWVGKTDADVWPPQAAADFAKHDRLVVQQRQALEVLERVPVANSQRYWLSSKFPMVMDDGSLLLGSASLDITERIQTEHSLRETTQILNGILGHLPVMVVRLDENGCIREARGKGLEAVGLTQAQLQGVDCLERFPSVASSIRQSLQGDSTHFLWKFDGDPSCYFDAYFFFDNEGGKGAIGFAINITERVNAEESSKLQSQMLNAILSHMPVVAGRIDPHGKVTEAAGLGLKRFGLSPKDLIGQNVLEHPMVKANVEKALAGEPVDFPLEGSRGGEQWFLDNSLFFDNEKGGAIFFARDVTDTRMLEKQLLEAASEEQQRIGGDLHDGLGQHLTGIACMASALKSELKGKRLKGNALQLSTTIADLVQQAIYQTRALARGLCPVQIEQHGLQSALEDLAFNVQEMHKVKCRVSFAEDIKLLDHGVALHLYRIAQEAINNSLKHAEATAIAVHLGKTAEDHILTITDDGVGLAEKRSNRPSMGLRMMEYRSKMIGGHLKIESAPSQGTKVNCTFRNTTYANHEPYRY